MKSVKCVLAVIGVILATGPIVAQGDMVNPPPAFPGLALMINEHGQGPPEGVNPPGQKVAENKWNYKGTHTKAGRYTVEYDIDADPDPVLHITLKLIREQAGPQDFTFLITLTVDPMPGETLTGGSVAGSILDSGGDGAELSLKPTGEPLYMSRIDGVDHKALMEAMDAVVVPAYETDTFGPESYGVPIPSLPGPPATSTIEIELNARISGYDTATLQASFVVVVPEPGTMALLGIGAAVMMLRRRRR